jgi:hypothetical protein
MIFEVNLSYQPLETHYIVYLIQIIITQSNGDMYYAAVITVLTSFQN